MAVRDYAYLSDDEKRRLHDAATLRIAELENRISQCDAVLHMISTWDIVHDVSDAIADARSKLVGNESC